ncbi:MAG: hypothetical protein ACKO6F_06440, partial [Cyanobium sp.]
MTTVISLLLSVLLLLVPFQPPAQAADGGLAGSNAPTTSSPSLGAPSSSTFPCPNPEFKPEYPAELELLNAIPASAEICVPYGTNQIGGYTSYGFIKFNAPLRPSNLVYNPFGASGSSGQANLVVTWNCPMLGGGTTPVDAPITCTIAGLGELPTSATVKFEYDYTD